MWYRVHSSALIIPVMFREPQKYRWDDATNAIKHFDKTIVCWEMKYGEKQNRDRDSD